MVATPPVRVFWWWNSEAELHDGLYGYRAFLDASPGSTGKDGSGRAYDDAISKRMEVDACMEGIADLKRWCLLDGYFRQGRCDEGRGWIPLARAVNLEVKPKHMSGSRAKFDVEICRAVRALWKVHLDRRAMVGVG